MDESQTRTIKVLVLTKEVDFEVKGSTTISQLKQIIQGRANIMFIGKVLTFNDAELNDDDTIAGINCQNVSLIKVVNKA